MRPHAVFVCAAPTDTTEGERYATALQASGLDVWYDRTGLQVGTLITDTIEQHLRQRTALVVLLTPASVRSHWVKMQVGAFLALMEEDESRVLVPVRVSVCDIPLLLQALPWIEGLDRPFEEVIRDLAQAVGDESERVKSDSAAFSGSNDHHSEATPSSRVEDSSWTVHGRRAHILALANQKGRIGKTTSAVNLAAYLADAGHRTLLVDMAPDAEATTSLGVDARHVETSLYDVLLNQTAVQNALIANVRPHLTLLPSKGNLWSADIELAYAEHREFRLRNQLLPLVTTYDYILIDCPSSLGMLGINAMTPADGILLPLECEYFALEGMQQLLNTIRLIRDRLNPTICLFGVILTMYDPRTKLGSEVVREISEHFPKERFQTVIPRTVRLAEAPSFGQTILEHDPRSPGALAYKQLTEEVVARCVAMWEPWTPVLNEEQPTEESARPAAATASDAPPRRTGFLGLARTLHRLTGDA